MSDFLKFLFLESQQEASADLVEEALERLFEDLEAAPTLEKQAKPLAAILKELGVSVDLQTSVGEMCLVLSDPVEYAQVLTALSEPETVCKLAEAGWVAAPTGVDNTVHFVCVDASEEADGTHNEHAEVDLEKLIKDAAKESGSEEAESAIENEKKAKIKESDTTAEVLKRLLA